jgi:pimeloyl-ACP methyl ester carboxylesterase
MHSTPLSFVLVHGAWSGGWDWKNVERNLRARGHDVYRATLTGLGERAHLASPEVNLSPHIADVVNAILFEDLHDVVLVGHSYAGMVISGVNDRIPERIRCQVFIDALLPDDGESAKDVISARLTSSEPPVPVNGLLPPTWHVPPEPPHDVPHPAKTFSEPVSLKSLAGQKVPAVYILLIDANKMLQEDSFYNSYVRAQQRGWETWTFESDHNIQRSHLPELVEMLEKAPAAAKPARTASTR